MFMQGTWQSEVTYWLTSTMYVLTHVIRYFGLMVNNLLRVFTPHIVRVRDSEEWHYNSDFSRSLFNFLQKKI